MIKRSPSRNHRSKGIKIKHVLQIILLVGVCFWLIYQVKRSHDKKKEFDESDAKVLVGTQTQTAYQIPKLGRKDLHPRKNEVNQSEKREEEEEDDNIVEDEDKHEHKQGNVHDTEAKEDDKHGEKGGEEQEEGENKIEEMEDERGAGDDEIDENDLEKSVVDADRGEEFIDEEKEKEKEGDEKENEHSEDEAKKGSVENHNGHEAREENYRGDDASSAVTHDTHTTITETETVSLENSNVNTEMGITKSENKPNYTEDGIRNKPSSDFNITEVKLTGGTYSNATSDNETRNSSLSNPVDSSHLKNIALTYSDSHSDASNNLTVVIPGAINNMTGTGTSSEHNTTVILSNQAQNDTVNTTVTGDVKNVQTERLQQGGNGFSEENLSGSNLTVPVKAENGAAAGGESSNLEDGDIEKTRRFVASNETENMDNTEMSEINKTRNLSYVKEKSDATKDEASKGDTQTSETSNSSSSNGTSDSLEHHATDSYDSHILKGVTEVRTDLDTLPEISYEADHNGDATATG